MTVRAVGGLRASVLLFGHNKVSRRRGRGGGVALS